jgi:hypothetical protein
MQPYALLAGWPQREGLTVPADIEKLGPLWGVCYAQGRFLAVSLFQNQVVELTTDGCWTLHDTRCGAGESYGIALGRDTLVVVGRPGVIIQSDPLLPPPSATLKVRRRAPVELELLGEPSRRYRIEHTGSLPPGTTWQTLTNLTLATNSATFADSPPPTVQRRYYRAVSLP